MEPLSAEDPRTIGEFRLHARLGAGGMGQVFLGFSPAGRAVAIKILHSQFARDQEFLQRFSREVAAASAVSGMYTAPVVGSGLNDNPPWLATAFVPGPPLAAVIGKYGPLPEAATWRLAAGLAEALKAVHAVGLVHRDLKPANVLLADDGPHVIDFGISRAFQGTQLTSAGMVIGTPGYMSPEQAEGLASGPPSDIFSLGCVLAYTATGNAPFGEGTAASILYRVVRSEPDLSAVPAGLRQVVEACLKKNPAERPDPNQLIGMISAYGPATAATLGSFWPESVARVIAAEQASQTPAGLTPPPAAAPASFAGSGAMYGATQTSGPGGWSGPASGAPSAAAPLERTPTALATPSSGQATGMTGAGGTTGHAPMIKDGYSPSGWPQQSGNGTPWPANGAPSGPGGDALSQYRLGSRNPGSSEIPGAVHAALRLMYVGFAATLASLITAGQAFGRYSSDSTQYKNDGHPRLATAADSMAGWAAVAVCADAIGLVCWVVLAVACRRGRGWTRITGTVLLALYTVIMLLVLLGTHGDPGARFTTLIAWACGVGAVIPLWTQPARNFFAAWRKR